MHALISLYAALLAMPECVPSKERPVILKIDTVAMAKEMGRDGYDPKTGRLRVHMGGWSTHMGVVAALDEIKQPFIMEFIGTDPNAEFPLSLWCAGKSFALTPKNHDPKFFRVQYVKGVTIVEFLEPGKALLITGTKISYQRYSW